MFRRFAASLAMLPVADDDLDVDDRIGTYEATGEALAVAQTIRVTEAPCGALALSVKALVAFGHAHVTGCTDPSVSAQLFSVQQPASGRRILGGRFLRDSAAPDGELAGNGELAFSRLYQPDPHHRSTVELVAGDFADALRGIARDCRGGLPLVVGLPGAVRWSSAGTARG